MMQSDFTILENVAAAADTLRLTLRGDTAAVTRPGQFVDIRLPERFLRRPISVANKNGDTLTLVYKILGGGTAALAAMAPGTVLNLLTGLGNGFDPTRGGERPLLLGGGVGAAPLLWLARALADAGKSVTAILGFNSEGEVFFEEELRALGVRTLVATADGSRGVKGFVTDALSLAGEYSYTYACGPEAMLRAVYRAVGADGEYSFEERMGCGFGACMGCTCETVAGPRRICRDGPVLRKEEILWQR